jgi:hypothetical protein
MACEITSGISISCDALKRVGGVNKRLWLFNLTALSTPIVALTDGYVTNIPLTTYQSLYKIEGAKFAHSFEINEQRSDEGNVQFEHKVMIKVVHTTPTQDAVLEDLTTSDVVAVIQTNNNEFVILGAQNGLSATELKIGSGQKSGDSSASAITLTGNEQSIYKRLLRTDVNTTLTYLNAMSA